MGLQSKSIHKIPTLVPGIIFSSLRFTAGDTTAAVDMRALNLNALGGLWCGKVGTAWVGCCWNPGLPKSGDEMIVTAQY